MASELFGYHKAADLSPCGLYRWQLQRVWDEDLPLLGWVLLNPSKADADLDDPTVRKCMGFARRAGRGGIVVTNLFAYRATEPKDLKAAALRGLDVIGPQGDVQYARAAQLCGNEFVVGWGTHGGLADRDLAVLALLRRCGAAISCLGETKERFPRHPLFTPYGRTLQPYPATPGLGAYA